METQQELVGRIIKFHLSRGLQLYKPEQQNCLFLHYMANHIEAVKTLIWSQPEIERHVNEWINIESAVATAADIAKGDLVIEGYENIKDPKRTPGSKVIKKKLENLTDRQRLVLSVMHEAYIKKIPIDPYAQSTKLILRCWKLQSSEWSSFTDLNEHVEFEATLLESKAISITRLRRFWEEEIEKTYAKQ